MGVAYKRGFDAYYDGFRLKDNPYKGNEEVQDWISGFRDAQRKAYEDSYKPTGYYH